VGRPVVAFLDEITEYSDDELLPDSITETRYLDRCEVRVDVDDERVRVTDPSHRARTVDEHIVRVNAALSSAAIRLNVQFDGDSVTGSWTDALAQGAVGLHVPEVDHPSVLRWEARGTTVAS